MTSAAPDTPAKTTVTTEPAAGLVLPECPLCLQRKPHNFEDIFPEWMRKAAKPMLPDGYSPPPRTGARVCRDCNTALKPFQDRAAPVIKPIMRTGRATLSEGDQVAIAGWVAQAVLVRMLTSPIYNQDGGPLPPIVNHRRATLLRMMKTHAPPERCSVRIQALAQQPEEASRPTVPVLWPPPWMDDLWPPTAVVLSFGLMVTEFVLPMPGSDVEQFIALTADDPWMMRVWPPAGGDLDYPSARLLKSDMHKLSVGVGGLPWFSSQRLAEPPMDKPASGAT